MNNTILTFDKMQQIKPCSENNENFIKILIGEVEFAKIKYLLGNKVYSAILDEINSEEISPELEEILEGGLYKCISYFTYARYIQESALVDTFTGFVHKVREDAQTAPVGQLKNVANEYVDMAMKAFEDIKCKIDKKYSCFKDSNVEGNNFSKITGVRRKINSSKGTKIYYL